MTKFAYIFEDPDYGDDYIDLGDEGDWEDSNSEIDDLPSNFGRNEIQIMVDQEL